MSDRIYTDIEPLLSIQRGLVALRDHIRPIEQKFKKVLDEYDSEISETLGTIDNGSDDEIDEEDRLKKLEQKKADLQEKKAACVAYVHAKEEFLRALDVFYSSEGNTTDRGFSVLSNSISALENYLNAGQEQPHTQIQSRDSDLGLEIPGAFSKTSAAMKGILKNKPEVHMRHVYGSFGGIEIDAHVNKTDFFIKGDNYERFKMDYYSKDQPTEEEYDAPIEIDVAPSMIEGVHLGIGEVEDPSVFWGQHEKNGTIESFMEIASHIPDVRRELALGRSLEDLSDDPELSKCTYLYFIDKPTVIENEGYYEFVRNGRHRILAARAVGHSIPVQVIGRKRRKNND